MDATRSTPQPRSHRGRFVALVVAVVVHWLAAADAQAAPLRSFAAAPTSAAVGPTLPPAWNRFLSAPSVWSARQSPAFTLSVRHAILQILNGAPATLSTNPMIEYLEWRRALNPTRFDRYHPYLGPQLGQIGPPVAVAPLKGLPPTAAVEPPITPLATQTAPPVSVPEPNGLVLIALISAVGLWRRSRTVPRAN